MNTKSHGEQGVSDGALSGMVILGLIATLMVFAVLFNLAYIRYSNKRLRNQERMPLIADESNISRFQNFKISTTAITNYNTGI